MTLSSGQMVRLKIQDQPLIADATLYGDGQASAFALPHRNITSGSAFIPLPDYAVSAGIWSATGAAFDPTGQVVLGNVISANSAFRVRYVYSTFSEDEIEHFVTVGGNINGAALEAVQALMFDGLKRARWTSPDGASYDDTAAMSLLNNLYARLVEERAQDAVTNGTFWSWSEEQGNY